ncbi:DNA-3-methyladenine glycosylase [Radiobacillus kanasensis]|uniref:DNA-3-methyladenine glycosylase family protein n=1 Tax=Radiobacillus kanasensis TaxID=2844358 RepID=UPI001E35453F|nr:DNA glycosylase [Radiobacillus kanasensis]UFT99252.1 DNA-3-methyladenine glycosylase [Radiobacillus kanasensis]
MRWNDHKTWVEIIPPNLFSYAECLHFLSRSDSEILHQINGDSVYKLIEIKEAFLLLKVTFDSGHLMVEIRNKDTSLTEREQVARYVWEWFGFDQDLEAFYQIANQDELLKPIVSLYDGLRIVSIPDLFEALTWAIIGQQINLTFAYKLKKRFVETYGSSLSFDGKTYWIFPSAQIVANFQVEDLTALQFSARKAEYVIGVAQDIAAGKRSKKSLLDMQSYSNIHAELVSVRGVGAWTADYCIMRCLQHPSAFPIADVGLHNALKKRLNWDRKPSLEEIKEWSKAWEGWEAFATFYLWRYLDE